MPTKMNFRVGGEFIAEMKAEGKTYQDYLEWHYEDTEENRNLWNSILPAVPGDTWRIRWHRENNEEGPVAGYAICCPQCKKIHRWCSARNCGSRDANGNCQHSGISSCWQWSGEAESNTLTANPSLYAQYACGWHGWLRDGVLIP